MSELARARVRTAAHRCRLVAGALLIMCFCFAGGCMAPEKRQMGESFEIGTVSYVVRSKQVRNQLNVAGTIMNAGPEASFVLIDYQMRNHGPSDVTVDPSSLRLAMPDQTEYELDMAATYALRMEQAFSATDSGSSSLLRAGQSGLYTVVFRVPDDAARGRFEVLVRNRVSVTVE